MIDGWAYTDHPILACQWRESVAVHWITASMCEQQRSTWPFVVVLLGPNTRKEIQGLVVVCRRLRIYAWYAQLAIELVLLEDVRSPRADV